MLRACNAEINEKERRTRQASQMGLNPHCYLENVCVKIRSEEIPCKSFSNFKKTETSPHLTFCLHLAAFLSPGIGYRTVVFKYPGYVRSVNQMRLF